MLDEVRFFQHPGVEGSSLPRSRHFPAYTTECIQGSSDLLQSAFEGEGGGVDSNSNLKFNCRKKTAYLFQILLIRII